MRRLTPIVFLCLPAAARAGPQPSRFVPRRVHAPFISASAAPAIKPPVPAPAAARLPDVLAPAPAAQEAVQEVNQALAGGRIEPCGGDSPARPLAPSLPRAARETHATPQPQGVRRPEDAFDRDYTYKEWHLIVSAFLEVALIVAIPLLLTRLLGLQ